MKHHSPTQPADAASQESDRSEIERDIARTATALSNSEVVSRFGSANAEFIKGYSGVDNETGQKFAKGLKDIFKHKINPEYADNNIKQQAGFSAEVAATSRDNAEAIINKSSIRTSRSDDLPQYGKNHGVVDRAKILNGKIVTGSETQMKFVGDRNALLKQIAREDGEFARYRGIIIELPSEQFEGDKAYWQDLAEKSREKATKAEQKGEFEKATKFHKKAKNFDQNAESGYIENAKTRCKNEAQRLRKNAAFREQKGELDAAVKLRREADNYDRLADNVSDSGLTTTEAVFYRTDPKKATAMDIARTSHSAGKQGAQGGAIVGGCISLLTNGFAVCQNKKEMGDAAQDLAIDTAKAAALGYAAGSVGAAIKGVMQQSGRHYVRTLASTSAPTLAVNICISLSSSVKRYVTGEISEAELLTEVGEKGAGMLSAGMMAALGQLAIPVPFVGAAIGGMIGYTLSSIFYQATLDAARGVELSRDQLKRTQVIQTAARARIAQEQAALSAFMQREIPQLLQETQDLFTAMEAPSGNINTFAEAVNRYASLMGKQLQFSSIEEFDTFMDSDAPLRL